MRWFLSYHSPDQTLAERLKAGIERSDSSSQVFFAPTSLRAGGAWTSQLAQELAEVDAFVFLVGEAGVGSWQVPEYDEALDRWVKSGRRFPLIVILLEGQKAPGLPFLRQLHWIVAADPASEKDLGRLFDAASGHGGRLDELWRFTSPYRGLEAMEEKDSDYFFGRNRETVEALDALAAPDRLPVLIGNSGVGKSSLAQAGVLAALKRQAWPEEARNDWPEVFKDSRRWCYLSLRPGIEPVGALVEAFLETWRLDRTSTEWPTRRKEWVRDLVDGKLTLRDLLDQTKRRYEELQRSHPPAYCLYVDQGEELYVRAEERHRRRFSELLVEGLADPRLRTMMSMRADFLGALQSDKPLFRAHHQINVPPLGEDELRQVVSRPAQLLGARFEPDGLIDIITRRTLEDSIKDVGALPLLSYTLDDMWGEMARHGDGRLRLPAQSFELGGVLVGRANRFLAEHQGVEDSLRRIFTLRLATVREDGEPTRRRAVRSEFSDQEWRLVSELADYPNRLLVIAAPAARETYAEVAHEAIFRRWDKLREWIAAEREFLAWRSGLEGACRAWAATPEASKQDALLMGAALAQAQSWLAKRAEDLPAPDRDFVAQSIAREKKAQAGARRFRALVYVLLVGIIVVLIGWINQSYIGAQWRWYTITRPYMVSQVRPYVLTAAKEQALKPKDTFRECAPEQGKDYCPEMVVVPAGAFTMGSPAMEKGQTSTEEPQHMVTIAKPFAVSKFELTFDEWDICVANGDCPRGVSDSGWGREQRPVINVTWDDAQYYVAWLSKVTGQTYRLLSEAEYEYAARAGKQTAYPWGNDIHLNGTVMANCKSCGSQWDGKQTAPVGSFAANGFGLYDMVGNVFEWVEDCVHDNYVGAPTDGSAWMEGGDCNSRVVRGGSWDTAPIILRSAHRGRRSADLRGTGLGFRVGRTLTTP
jgi:formylglycine-generating enzyme required for sulfatase activity